MKHTIDIDTWKRKENFLFFKDFANPCFGITVEIDCTVAYTTTKQKTYPISLYCMHAALVAANRIEEFKYRTEGDGVIRYDTLNLNTPIMAPDERFRTVILPYHEKIENFLTTAAPIIERAKRGEGDVYGNEDTHRDVILISVLPWIRFTSIQIAGHRDAAGGFPMLAFGKITEENGKRLMPVSINANHAFMDGFHVARFLDEFQNQLNR